MNLLLATHSNVNAGCPCRFGGGVAHRCVAHERSPKSEQVNATHVAAAAADDDGRGVGHDINADEAEDEVNGGRKQKERRNEGGAFPFSRFSANASARPLKRIRK